MESFVVEELKEEPVWAPAEPSRATENFTISHAKNISPLPPNPDLCYVYETKASGDLFNKVQATFKEEINDKGGFEKASMNILRDFNSIENIIDFSLTPEIKRTNKYSVLWNPDNFEPVYNQMQTAEHDPDEETEDTTTTDTTREASPPRK